MKENYGNLEALKKLEEGRKNTFTTEQLIDENLKNVDGENRKEVTKRMEEAFNRVFKESEGKKIAIVSHGAAIKFLLMKWCSLNKENQIEYNKEIISLNSPGVIRLVFKDKQLIELKQII